MSTANVRKFHIFIPLDVLNSQHGCFICVKFYLVIKRFVERRIADFTFRYINGPVCIPF